jgi:hypothetical protein
MVAIDQANRTGNYSVLRALGSPQFQQSNPPAILSNVFAGIRSQRIDLANTVVFEPTYEFPPAIVDGLLRLRGMFRMRPTGVRFDLLYQWNGTWTLHAVALQAESTTQPAGAPR